MNRHLIRLGACAVLLGLACGGRIAAAEDIDVGKAGDKNKKPKFLGSISTIHYDGVSNDLLTAGLGKTGLAAAAPLFVNPVMPTPAELRRNAKRQLPGGPRYHREWRLRHIVRP